ncbi:hypothetical protein A3B02_02045 [Candidatus Roizmanbacteria bacterium RIFCSPLOWO2_01_FULL_42_14]|uniref:Uncharacterized protein n=4 Tax=Candidatus Roizmaniibacteriota TaxID=1752723 RepID=A0A1F7JW77_9BACT|nr:MAG: hypothetical protein A3D08_00210 [Candidatus Roizmanbacteria bacterium RIFCSPHIGHO2_02_FULL_43_11]OGK37952.1 MAG: hypothetical protein A3F32_02210 [Candidatus Roizmanbacteria bacterium RIFCSPHIGHO2_12_FULL_42_10]OGK52545.1 MAG: hypothetical protein A3B02_02045 [Candidatus Roizmanbacteria bacterium RIFCSPLOWO2_01_FULL_42_14]OGK59860.1 MAG: hypothetical protein A3I56_03250 [Candidatus Roizmanbacteria bacterium RIFCSPLOWO2_02_FULL_43_10]
MKKHFYSHIVRLEDVHQELTLLDISDEEKKHLLLVFESTMHHIVVDVVLTHLPDEHKKPFIHHVSKENHDGAWSIIKEHIQEPEQKIREAVEALKQELLADIQKSRQNFS